MELFNFFKTITILVTTLATSLTIAVNQINQPLDPVAPAGVASEVFVPKIPTKSVAARAIDVHSLVGIFCTFTNSNPDSPDYKKIKHQRGSGVIVNSDGFILANRVVVDPAYNDPDWDDYQLNGCQAGPAPKEFRIPSDQEIRTINPFIQVPVLSFVVEPVFAPYETEVSDYEQNWLDFTLLLITDLAPDARAFGITSLPKKFPYTPILISEVPLLKNKIVNFGYPAGTTIGLHASANTIFLQGLLAHITGLWTGDQRFKGELFLLQSALDTEGTAEGGRFGSPIFWKGYVVGLHIFKEDRSLTIYNLGIEPIADILNANGITMFDDPQ